MKIHQSVASYFRGKFSPPSRWTSPVVLGYLTGCFVSSCLTTLLLFSVDQDLMRLLSIALTFTFFFIIFGSPGYLYARWFFKHEFKVPMTRFQVLCNVSLASLVIGTCFGLTISVVLKAEPNGTIILSILYFLSGIVCTICMLLFFSVKEHASASDARHLEDGNTKT